MKHTNGMTIVIVDATGKAVNRKWFKYVDSLKAWLDWNYPHFDNLGYSLEIYYD